MKDMRGLGTLLQLSWMMALAVLAPLGLGLFLDSRLHTSPWLFLLGALIGIIGGTVGAVRIATRAIAEAESQRPPANPAARAPSRGQWDDDDDDDDWKED